MFSQMGWFNHQLDYPLDFVAQAGLPEDGSPQRTVRLLLLFRGENGSPCGSDFDVSVVSGVYLNDNSEDILGPKTKLLHPRS